MTGEYGLQADSGIQKTGKRMRPEEGPDTGKAFICEVCHHDSEVTEQYYTQPATKFWSEKGESI